MRSFAYMYRVCQKMSKKYTLSFNGTVFFLAVQGLVLIKLGLLQESVSPRIREASQHTLPILSDVAVAVFFCGNTLKTSEN